MLHLEKIKNMLKEKYSEEIRQMKWQGHRLPFFSPNKGEAKTCVIANGIPKSGTHLGLKIIEYFGRWERLPITIADGRWVVCTVDDLRILYSEFMPPNLSLQKIQNGQFVSGHISWSKRNERIIASISNERHFKHILMYRDPRDIFVSHLNFVMKVGSAPNSAYKDQKDELMMKLDYDEQLEHVIKRCQRKVEMSSFLPDRIVRF